MDRVIGQSLAQYNITAALGAGGIGEVYRAIDTTLNRDVAIKVFPAEVAQDPQRLARFRREAQLLAALNHPNIASIYGLEEADGKPFLALELVEGEDLQQRLERGAVPVDEALEIAGRLEKNLGSVSRWVTTAAERRSSDSGFARRLKKLDKALRGERPTNELEML